MEQKHRSEQEPPFDLSHMYLKMQPGEMESSAGHRQLRNS